MRDYVFLQKKYLVPTYINRALTLVKGENVYLYDQNGRKYLDMMSNIGVNIFGYNHPKITSVLKKQINRLTNLHCSFTNDVRSQTSKKLVNRCGSIYSNVYWSNSGTEAVEAALKFAVLATKKKRFIVMKGGFHGKTLGALSATENNKYRKYFEPLLWDFVHIDFGKVKQVEEAIDDNTAAVLLEPIQGEAGIILPKDDYLQRVRKICGDNDLLLILDEVQTGIGRTGAFLASHNLGAFSDILCLGKGLAAGFPVGATIITSKISQNIPKSVHTSTFGGNPFACSATLAVLDLLDKKMLSHVKETGDYFLNSLKKIRTDNIVDVRGKGLMVGIEVTGNRDYILKELQKNFILAIPAGTNMVRFLPPYVIEKDEIDNVVEILKKIFRHI